MPAPRLRLDFNLGCLKDLPAWSAVPPGMSPAGDLPTCTTLAASGYGGVQGGDPAIVRQAGLVPSSSARLLTAVSVADAAQRFADQQQDYATCHLGTELMDDATIDALAAAVLDAEQRHGVPIWPELHRATALQDGWRTLRLVERFPALRFNADLSHWYTGHEMPYGDFTGKLDAYQPVFSRVRCFHGRIGNSSHMQVAVRGGRNALAVGHFQAMWKRCMQGYLDSGEHVKALPFAPELLQVSNRYAREFPQADGSLREESDRWLEAIELCSIARGVWREVAGPDAAIVGTVGF